MIEVLLALVCYSGGRCEEPSLPMAYEAAVVAMCESGDTLRLGSLDWEAVNVNVDGTRDTGAFQMNSYWVWSGEDRWFINQFARELKMSPDTLLAAWPTAGDAPPAAQLKAFYLLWDEGRGSSHWAASQHCWGPLLERAVPEHYVLGSKNPERLVLQIRRLGLWARVGEDYGTVIVPADRKRLAQVWKSLGGGPSHRPWEMLSEIDGNVAE